MKRCPVCGLKTTKTRACSTCQKTIVAIQHAPFFLPDSIPMLPLEKIEKLVSQHTPTPWFTSSDNRGIIVGGKRLGMMNKAENTAFIVRAVNAHEELLEALHFIKHRLFAKQGPTAYELDECRYAVTEAIAKAEGK